MTHLPDGKFGVIYADPPWQFLTYSGASVPQRAEEQHYDTMSLEEIKALPVGDVAAKDCALFMWVIDSHFDQAFDLANHWGFQFKTRAFTWRKVKKSLVRDIAEGKLPEVAIEADDATHMGLGKWTRKETEFCLLFTRGKPKRLSGGVREIINAPRREHSRKPDETYGRIEELVGGPYLELFSRTTWPGWEVWGNQTGKFRKLNKKAESLL